MAYISTTNTKDFQIIWAKSLEIEVNFHHCCHCCHIAPAPELPYFKGISANLWQQWQQFREKQNNMNQNGAVVTDLWHIWMCNKLCSSITRPYFAIRHPYLKITLPYWRILGLCWKNNEIYFCSFEIIAYLCIRTPRRLQLWFISCCNVGCLSGGGGETSWKIITSGCCYSELLQEPRKFKKPNPNE